MNKGFSLIEILVVIGVFAIIGLITSQSVLTSLKGARKADAETQVRQNIDYTTQVIDRQLRSAKSVSCVSATEVDFVDSGGQNQSFSKSDNAILFSSQELSSSDISITDLSFTCSGTFGVTQSVGVAITGLKSGVDTAEQSPISTQLTITLRNH